MVEEGGALYVLFLVFVHVFVEIDRVRIGSGVGRSLVILSRLGAVSSFWAATGSDETHWGACLSF